MLQCKSKKNITVQQKSNHFNNKKNYPRSFLFMSTIERQISGHHPPPTGKTRLDECLRIHVIAKTSQEIGKVTKNSWIHFIADIRNRKQILQTHFHQENWKGGHSESFTKITFSIIPSSSHFPRFYHFLSRTVFFNQSKHG